MLSAVGRSAIRRVVAGASRPSTNRVFQSVWHVQRVDIPLGTNNALGSGKWSFSLRRSLSTAAKAKPSTARTKAKAKTPVKKAAKKPVKKKAKKLAAKPKLKAKPKKEVTPEQKLKLKIKELKAIALSPPKPKPATTWTVILTDYITKSSAAGKPLSSLSKEASAQYTLLSPSELESYNHTANQNKAENDAALRKWVESHTPEQIRLANNARTLLKKLTGKVHGLPLRDSRIPKRLRSEHALFAQDRWASGDYKGVKIPDAGRLVWEEYLALPEGERKAYKDRADADKQRYIREYQSAFHRDPPFIEKQAIA